MKKTLLFSFFSICALASKAQVQWVGNMTPLTGSSNPLTISVEVFKNGITFGPGPGDDIHCEILYGQVTAFGQPWSNTTSITMTYSGENTIRDIQTGTLTLAGGNYEYTCRCADVPNPTQFDWLYQGAANGQFSAPLPVTLISFKGKSQNRVNELSWATATEFNSKYFQVERAGADLEWEQLETINGTGNSTDTQWYRFTDESPLDGTNYYRLKQIDIDGNFTYSYSIKLATQRQVVQSVFPNPVSSFLQVQMSEEAQVTILNAVGIPVFDQITDGSQPISMAEMQSGLYLLKVTDLEGNLLHTEKLAKY
jgi:Secretion system C-terminal sorting domain